MSPGQHEITRTAGAYPRPRGGGSPSGRSDRIRVSALWADRGKVVKVTEDSLSGIRDRMRLFTEARDWERFHDPKSLTLALVGEVGELAELLQWLPAEQVTRLAADEPLRTRLGEELSDILLYLVRLSDVLDVDLPSALAAKMTEIESRFPPGTVQGVAPTKN